MMVKLFFIFFATIFLTAATADIPSENLQKGDVKTIKSAEDMAKRLLQAIIKDDPDSVKDLFFPRTPFEMLKDIPRPGEYFEKLLASFAADIHREHKKIKNGAIPEFDSFKQGSCKWKAPGSEYNKIGYWSCFRSHFYAKMGSKKITFELRVMINWGKNWYVTHLGSATKG